MLENSQRIKNRSLLKNFSFKSVISSFNLKYLILPFIILVINAYIQRIYECKELELIPLQNIYNKITPLKNNLIVKAHNLNSNSEQFIQHIERYLDNEKSKILDIKVSEPHKLSNIHIIPIEIKSNFIHDKFIFEFINQIHEYSGFVRTVAVKINKRCFNNGYHILETVIVCALYTK